MRTVWCVKWVDRERGVDVWCATERGRKPDSRALTDPTRCGATVVMRHSAARRLPTCTECRAKMRLATAAEGDR